MNRLTRKIQLIDEEIERVKSVNIGTGSEVQRYLQITEVQSLQQVLHLQNL